QRGAVTEGVAGRRRVAGTRIDMVRGADNSGGRCRGARLTLVRIRRVRDVVIGPRRDRQAGRRAGRVEAGASRIARNRGRHGTAIAKDEMAVVEAGGSYVSEDRERDELRRWTGRWPAGSALGGRARAEDDDEQNGVRYDRSGD